MRRLTFLLVIASAACRPRDKIKVESPAPEVLSSVVNTSDPAVASQLIAGFHEIEQGSWRWTAGKFAVAFKPPVRDADQAGRLVMHCSVPEALVSRVGAVTLTAKLNGDTLGVQKWDTPGEYTFSAPVPASQLMSDAVTVDFHLDRFLPGGQADTRELGLIVTSIAIEAAE